MTPNEFIERFPEFRTGLSLVREVLADATQRVDPTIFGSRTDMAIGLLAAHLLSISPYGRSQRLEGDETEDQYLREFDAIRREVAPRMIVV